MNEKNFFGFFVFFIQIINKIPNLSFHVFENAWTLTSAKFNPITQKILEDLKLLALNPVLAKLRCDNNHTSPPPSCSVTISPSLKLTILLTGDTMNEIAVCPLSIWAFSGLPL